jgi:hypothetical protein
MIGWRGFQIVELPRASSRSARIAPQRRSRSPPGPSRKRNDLRYGAGPAEATASPGKPISTRIDYGTESVVTSHITPARSQCKSPISRSSCGIAQTDGAVSAIRASEVGP